MKKTLLLFLFISIGLSKVLAQATCYTESEKKQVDFWLNHQYYAICTDYLGSGSKLFGGNPEMIDFNGGSTIDFTDVFVSKEGTYTLTLWYGVGWGGDMAGRLNLFVNGDIFDQLVFGNMEGIATADFEIELYEGYNNTIQFKQTAEWPTLSRIQLTSAPSSTGLTSSKEYNYSISSTNKSIAIDKLEGVNTINTYTMNGNLVKSVTTTDPSINIPADNGLYIVKINGNAHKVAIK